jgi:Carboxypeptidase regulatory-like domain/TonB dependent receptor
MRFRFVAAWTVVGASIAIAPLHAQDARGTLLGRVSDQSGAGIVGAKVEGVNTDTGVHSASTSNSSGDYILPYLIPGPYNVTVEQNGFKTFTRTGILLREGDRVSADVTMQVGDATQSVEVTAAAPLLDTSTASLGQTVDERAITELPTKDGMVLIMATFAPGVTFTPASAAYIRPFDTGSPSSISVNGTKPGANEFQVDGTPNLQGQQIAYSPPQAVVSELKVQTSTFDASWGFNTGAAINMTLKSGTNSLHGQVDYFMQNPALNADNYFRLSTGKPGFRIHRYGASATGPIVLPKIFNGRNRTFFTYGFEGVWSFDPSPWVVETVPTAAERTGDFSALLAISPAYQIYDPYSTVPIAGGKFQRTPLAGNIIPASRINPVAAKIASLWDAPNQRGTIDGTNNYTMGKNAQDTYWNHLARVDHNISEKQRLYGRVDLTSLLRPENIRQNKTVGDNFYRFNHGAALDHVYIVSPSFVVDSRYSFMRFTTGYTPYQQGWDLASLGFSPAFTGELQQLDPRALKFPNINVSSLGSTVFSPLGGVNTNNQQIYMIHEGAVNLTNIVGAHTVRSGVTYRDYLENAYDLGTSSGALNFDSTWTGGPINTSAPAPIGQDFASFLYGLPASGSLPINNSFAEKQRYWALYAQDDWKVTTKLTVSMGLRYELPSPLTERFNRSVKSFDPQATAPIDQQALQNYAQNPVSQIPASAFRVNGGLTFASINGSSGLWKTSAKNFMPRFGFAYSLAPTTVLRGGYGIYYAPLGVTNVSVNQTGFSSSTAFVGSVDNGQTYAANLTNPFPGGFVRPVGAAAGPSTFLGQNVSYFDQNLRNPYVQHWQLAAQHQFRSSILLEMSYVGSRGTRLLTTQDINAVPAQYLSTSPVRDQTTINTLGAQVTNPFYPLLPRTNLAASTLALSQLLKPFPQFSGVTETSNGGSSWYHALQARTEKRFSGGLYASYSFTWSKYMEAISYLNPADTHPEHVISDQDRPFRSVATWVYELPFGARKQWANSTNRLVSHAISGWQMQGIYTNQSGQALGFGNAILLCGPGGIPLSQDTRTIFQWFNTSCFNRVSSQQLASNIRTVSTRFAGIRGPGVNNFDLSFIKNTQIREGVRLQFQAEAINALNHPQFVNPTTTPTSTAFGQVTGTFSWERIIELGLKLSF